MMFGIMSRRSREWPINFPSTSRKPTLRRYRKVKSQRRDVEVQHRDVLESIFFFYFYQRQDVEIQCCNYPERRKSNVMTLRYILEKISSKF